MFLPESLEFLVAKDKGEVRIRNIVARISPAIANDKQVTLRPTEKQLPSVPVKNLFTEKRGPMTILFWAATAGACYSVGILVYWSPMLLHKSGASVLAYSLAFSGFNFGA